MSSWFLSRGGDHSHLGASGSVCVDRGGWAPTPAGSGLTGPRLLGEGRPDRTLWAVISSETNAFLMKINISLDRGARREMFRSNSVCLCFVLLPWDSTSLFTTFLEMLMFRVELFPGSFQLPE